jgi:predicted metal-dependent hydrolase
LNLARRYRMLKPMVARDTESLLLPHGPTRVQWRRSARARRVSLRIDPREGSVIVTLPPRAAVSAGRALLMDHAGWVAERLSRLPVAVVLRDGAEVPFDGRPVRIRHMQGARGTLLAGDELLVSGTEEFLPRRVLDFLRSEARRRLATAALTKASLHGLHARRVVVKDTRTRWGSCTADGTLMFSWRLVMAPPEVQDYVVAHELAHLRHMDHSARFWMQVETMTPYRKLATSWLEKSGAGLMRIG